jgi:hypothetical protein
VVTLLEEVNLDAAVPANTGEDFRALDEDWVKLVITNVIMVHLLCS